MEIIAPNMLAIGSERFQLFDSLDNFGATDDEGAFFLGKSRRCLEFYFQLFTNSDVKNIMELGIFKGGSIAFFDMWLKPDKFVAVDILNTCDKLETWIDHTDSRGRIHTFYNVDQADGKRLTDIRQAVFGDEKIDLIVDDASHLWEETRKSFNVLFPHLRPGGAFIIEDWACQYLYADGDEDAGESAGFGKPLFRLIHEISLASARIPDVVSEVLLCGELALVRRGSAEISGPFDIGLYRSGG